MSCINKNSEEFKKLLKETGLSEKVLAAKIDAFQKKNGINSYPTAKDLLLKQINTKFKNVIGVPVDDRDKEKVSKEDELLKGFNNLKDKNGNTMPNAYVEEFTSTLVRLFFLVKSEKISSNKQVFSEIEKDLNDKYRFHKSITKKEHLTEEVLEYGFSTIKENQLVADYFKHILDNKEVYFDRVIEKIEKMGYSFVKNSTSLNEKSEETKEAEDFQFEIEEEALNEKSTEVEKTYDDDARSLRENPFDKLSPLIKRFLSFVPSDKVGILGLETYESSAEIYSSLLELTANKEYTYEELVQALKDNVGSKPYYQYLIDELTKDETELSQEEKDELEDLRVTLAKHFRLTYYRSKGLITKGDNYTTKAQVFDSNRNSITSRIKEEWIDKSLTSKIFKEKTGGTFLNERFISSTFEKQWDKIKESNYDIEEVKALLDMAGIDISVEALNYIKTNNRAVGLKSWETLFNKGGIFEYLYSYIKSIDPDKNIEEENPLAHENYINTLANVESKFRAETVVDNYRDGKGKSRYSHILPTWLFNRFNRLLSNKDGIIQRLKSLPYTSFSYWLGKIDTKDQDFLDNFKLEIFDSNSIEGNPVSFDEMSYREKLLTQINFFANRNNGKEGKKVSVFMTPSKSDKSAMHLITATRYNVLSKASSLKEGIFNDNDKDILLHLVRGEYTRIIDAQKKRAAGINFNDIQDYNPFRFYSYPELNDLKELWVNGELIEYDESNSEMINAIWEVVKKNTLSQMKELEDRLIKEEIIVSKVDKNNNEIQKLVKIDAEFVKYIESKGGIQYFLADYIINYNIAIANYDMLFQGDLAFASKPNKGISAAVANMFKRLAKDIAPASRMAYFKKNKDFNKYKQIFLKDALNSSVSIEQLKKILGDKYKDYLKIEGTDAQELTTLEEHLDVMYYYGKLKTSDYKKLIGKAKRGEEFSDKELDIVLQPMKPVHVGSYILEDYNAEAPVYIKTSSFPLVPQLIKKTEFAKLELAMRSNGIRRATFLSGAKLGAFKTIDLWNKIKDESGVERDFDGKKFSDGTINEDLLNKAIKDGAYLELSRDNFGIQQDVPFDPDKSSILEGSQLMKLILDGLKGDTVTIKKFHDLHIDIIEDSFKSFMEDIGASENPDGSFNINDLTKLQKLLVEELKAGNTNFTANDELALELNDSKTDFKTDFKIPIWASAKSEQYEALLNSIINKRVIKTKLPGKSYVLGTEEGFKGDFTGIEILEENRLVGTKYDPTTGLKPQRIGYRKGNKSLEESEYNKLEDKTGWEKVVFPAQVLVAKGTKFKGNKLVGYRIPTQGLNSMSAMEIVGYLPDYMADLIITPKDFTKQFGSDFDIDKLYVHRWYEDHKGNKYNKESIAKEWEKVSQANDTKILSELIILKDKVKIGEYLSKFFEELEYSEEEIQELVNDIYAKYPTEEEFFSKRMSKVKKNQIVDIYWNTLMDLNNLEEILSPLDMGNLPDVAETIKEAEEKKFKKEGKTNSGTHYLSPLRQIDNYENGNAGKFGVAVTSLISTFNALVQATEEDIYFNVGEEEGFKFKDNKGKEIIVSSLKGTKTLYGDSTKTKVISAFQSASVDNIKELLIQTINYNRDTHDAFTALSLLGLPENYISLFLAQPVIKDFVEKIKSAGDSYSSNLSKNEKIKEVIEELRQELLEKALEISKKESKPVSLDFDTRIDPNKPFSEKELLSQIESPNPKEQLELLKKFEFLSEYGTEVNNFIRAIRPSTSGMGKNRIEANDKTIKLKEIITKLRKINSKIKGLEPLIGEVKMIRSELTNIKATTFTGAGLNVIRKANNIFNRFFKINAIHHSLINKIEENKKTGLELSLKEQQTLIKFIKSYMFSANLALYRGQKVEDLVNDLLFSENSIAVRWNKFKQENPDNWLGNRIFPKETYSKREPDRLEYKASIIDASGDIRNIIELTEMLLSEDPVAKKLAEDTVIYSYITGGIQNATSMVKFININYLNMFGFGNNIHDLSKQIDINILEEQFYQNYPQYTPTLNSLSKDIEIDKDKATILGEGINKNLLPTYVHDPKSMKIYKLFPSNSNKIVYKELSRMGNSYYTETYFNKPNSKSSIKYKNVEEVSDEVFIKTEVPKVIEENNNKEVISNLPKGYESLGTPSPKTTTKNEITDKNSVSLERSLSEEIEIESVNTTKQEVIYESKDLQGNKSPKKTTGFKINFKGHPATEFYLLEDLNDFEQPVWSVLNKIDGNVRIPVNDSYPMGINNKEEALSIFLNSLNQVVKKLGTNTEGLAKLEKLKFNFTNPNNIQFLEEEVSKINSIYKPLFGREYTLKEINSLSEEMKQNIKKCL